MYLKKDTELCVLHAISPVHAGAGSATGAVDLPIQRERHSGWPHIQSSGVKGAFRDHCERAWMLKDLEIDGLVPENKEKQAEELAQRIFGRADEKSQAGAMAFSDAKLLAFPVRSNLAPFVWTTCPALLRRLARDLAMTGADTEALSTMELDEGYGLVIGRFNGDIILEDVCLGKKEGDWQGVAEIFNKLAPEVNRLVIVPDDQFSFLVETATEIQAQIKINAETGTTTTGLRYQELLPAETVLYTVVFFGEERAAESNRLQLDTLRAAVKDAVARHIQLGGDLTLGRGIFQVNWQAGGAA